MTSYEASLQRLLASPQQQQQALPDAVVNSLCKLFDAELEERIQNLFLQVFAEKTTDAQKFHVLQSSSRFWEIPFKSDTTMQILVSLSACKEYKAQIFSFFALKQIPFPRVDDDITSTQQQLLLEFVANLSSNAEIRDRVFLWSFNNQLGKLVNNEVGMRIVQNFAACQNHEAKQQVFQLDLFPKACDKAWGVRLALNLSNDNALEGLFTKLDFNIMFNVEESTAELAAANLAVQPKLKPMLFAVARKQPKAAMSPSFLSMMNNIVAGELALKRELFQLWWMKPEFDLLLESKERAGFALAQSLAGEQANAMQMLDNARVMAYGLESNMPLLWNLTSFDPVKAFNWLDQREGAFASLFESGKQVVDKNESKAAIEVIKLLSNHDDLKLKMLEKFKQDELFHQVFQLVMSKNKS